MYILKYAFKNIIRNPFISLSSIIVIWLLAFFIHVLMLVLFATNTFVSTINDRISITIPFQSDVVEDSLRFEQLFYTLRTTFPDVYVEYVSQDDAFEIFRMRNPDLAWLIESTDDNPLPSSVRLSGIPLWSYTLVQATVATYQDILEYNESELTRKLLDFQTQYARIESIVRVLQVMNYAVYGLLSLFLFTVFVVVYTVISNTIFFLRDEMAIIELVWGKGYFIYGPLVIQGLLYTLISSIFALFLFFSIPTILPLSTLPEGLVYLLGSFYLEYRVYILPSILIALMLGSISALVASWKYIHNTIWKTHS